jgi:quercetin dioxygenase-like cupin family protein
MTAFERHVVELAAGEVMPYEAACWHDAIVFVTVGDVELECTSGERHLFCTGDTLCLAPLPLRTLRNPGPGPARLLAVRRQSPVSSVERRRHMSDDFDFELEVPT